MLCPDYTLLVPLKRSAAYGAVRRRVADLRPADGWQDGGRHYFVFRLRPADGVDGGSGDEALAVFVMLAGGLAPVSAVTITTRGNDTEAEVVDLLQPARAHRLALS